MKVVKSVLLYGIVVIIAFIIGFKATPVISELIGNGADKDENSFTSNYDFVLSDDKTIRNGETYYDVDINDGLHGSSLDELLENVPDADDEEIPFYSPDLGEYSSTVLEKVKQESISLGILDENSEASIDVISKSYLSEVSTLSTVVLQDSTVAFEVTIDEASKDVILYYVGSSNGPDYGGLLNISHTSKNPLDIERALFDSGKYGIYSVIEDLDESTVQLKSIDTSAVIEISI